jgi:hypothetical protein
MRRFQNPSMRVALIFVVCFFLGISPIACQESASEHVDQDFEYHQVESSAIDTIGYSTSYQILFVRFITSYEYHYFEVPRTVFEDFLHAPSKGRYFNKEVKGQYRYQRLDPSP